MGFDRGFCAVYVHNFPHASTCWCCCVELMCKHVHFMWNIMPHGVWLWIFICSCLNFSTCIHMFFLLCENNVQVCAFHVECNGTRDLTVDFLLYMSNFFPHASTCNSCCVELMCKYVYFMWNFVTHGIPLWKFVICMWITWDNLWHFEKKGGKYVL